MKRSIPILAVIAALLIALAAIPILANGVSTVAVFNTNPEGLAVDEEGNIYVGLAFTGEIKKLTPDGSQISTFANLPSPGGGFMLGMAFADEGDLYDVLASSDSNHGIWQVSKDGAVEIFASLPTSPNFQPLATKRAGSVYIPISG